MAVYIHQLGNWPRFRWNDSQLAKLLSDLRYRQAKLLGRMEGLGFRLQEEASLNTITLDIVKSSEIEGEMLDPEQVRSSVARRLGMEIPGLVPSDRDIDGIVEMMLDATQHYQENRGKNNIVQLG